mmetsp:Transcript_10383/g.29417  ORF Transcript_10383/g.29417 Transcript_10383/m.29417 type:complete len:231 (+) Transcript_10383:44-736(+)
MSASSLIVLLRSTGTKELKYLRVAPPSLPYSTTESIKQIAILCSLEDRLGSSILAKKGKSCSTKGMTAALNFFSISSRHSQTASETSSSSSFSSSIASASSSSKSSDSFLDSLSFLLSVDPSRTFFRPSKMESICCWSRPSPYVATSLPMASTWLTTIRASGSLSMASSNRPSAKSSMPLSQEASLPQPFSTDSFAALSSSGIPVATVALTSSWKAKRRRGTKSWTISSM